MNHQNWTLLIKVPDLLMRGALVARLGEAQIEVYVPDRDAIVNVGTGPNLALEGYSALFDGYSVYVPKLQLSEAQDILKNFEAEFFTNTEKRAVEHASKFYFAAVMTWAIPLVLHVIAVYHFVKAIKAGEKWSYPKLIFSWIIWVITSFAAYYWVSPYLTWWI